MKPSLKGIPEDLYQACIEVFLECDEFDSNELTRSLFATQDLIAFRDMIPSATSKRKRVELLVDFLVNKSLGYNRLLLDPFVSVLTGQYAQNTDIYVRLKNIHSRIENFQSSISLSNPIFQYCDTLISEIREPILRQLVDLTGEIQQKTTNLDETLTDIIDSFIEDIYGEWLVSVDDKDSYGKFVGNLREKLISSQRVLLVGEPGAGKSTLLRRLVLDYIEIIKNTGAGKLPVFIQLSKFKGNISFNDFAISHIEILQKHLPNLNLVWLLDSFDEMPNYDVISRERDLLPELIDFLSGKNFILACRTGNFRSELNSIPNTIKLKINSLSPLQIHDIIYKRMEAKQAKELWKSLHGSKNLIDAWGFFDGYEDNFWREEIPTVSIQRKYYDTFNITDDDELSSRRSDDNIWQSNMPFIYQLHMEARSTIHEDPRKLILLCRNPFTLSVLINVAKKVGVSKLPGNRGVLFGLFSKVLLARESEKAKLRGEPWDKDLMNRVISSLTKIAYFLQKDGGIISIEYQNACDEIGKDAELILRIAEDANLITIDQDVRFSHKLLQEYFASHEMLQDLRSGVSAGEYITKEWWEINPWKETFIMLGEILKDPNQVAQWVAPYSPTMALNVLIENGDSEFLEYMDDDTKKKILESANDKIDHIKPLARASALKVLGILNSDNRTGVGLLSGDLPDISWRTIPQGKYTIGSNEADRYALVYEKPQRTVMVDEFRISKYPVTQIQFIPFLIGDYQNKKYWTAQGKKWLKESDNKDKGTTLLQISNVPYYDVNWHEAMAYCRWLTVEYRKANIITQNEIIRLPTEIEWEVAARGNDARIYPWGNIFNSENCNMNETGIDAVVAVGTFLRGESPNLVDGLSGNTWEWCLTDWDSYFSDSQGTGGDDVARVIRGGAYNSGRREMRCAYRHRLAPDGIISPIGFRVVRCQIDEKDYMED